MYIYALLFLNAILLNPANYSPWEFYHVGTAEIFNDKMEHQAGPYRVYSKTIYFPDKQEMVNENGRDVLGLNQSTYDGISTFKRLPGSDSFSEIANQNQGLIDGIMIMEGPEWNWSGYKIQRYLKGGELQEIEAKINGEVRSKVRWFNRATNSYFVILSHYYPLPKIEYDKQRMDIFTSRRYSGH